MMNSTILMNLQSSDGQGGYAIGALIALLILAYLLYALIKPEKF